MRTAEEVIADAGDMRGRTVVITGATNGIGRAAAVDLARAGARMVLAVRDPQRGFEVATGLRTAAGEPANAQVVRCDLSSFSSVRAAADEIASACPIVDVLCNNAGLIASERSITEDGSELTFQVNHLSHYLLTRLLLPQLAAARSARVVTVSSDAHLAQYAGIRFGDLGFERGWSPFRVYAHSKLANIMFAYELARRVSALGVASVAMHPGPVASNFGRHGWGLSGAFWDRFVPKLTPEQGADTLVFLASDASVAENTGAYYYRRSPKRSSRASYDRDAQSRLWRVSADLVGEPEEVPPIATPANAVASSETP